MSIVRKHRVSYGFWGGLPESFMINSAHSTRPEAKAVADEKNKKSQSFRYFVGKVEVKGGAA